MAVAEAHSTKTLPVTIATIILILLLWEFIASLNTVPTYLFPPPSKVLTALVRLIASGMLVREYVRTLTRVIVGFLLGSIIGISVGIAVSINSFMRDSLSPIIAFFASTPTAALIPLLMIWVGLNELLPITAVTICTSIPVVYNVISGLRSVDPETIGVARTLGSGRVRVLFTVALPQAVPSIFSALKLEAVMAWKTCFVSEALALSSGLGYLLVFAESTLQVDVLLAALLVLAASSYLFYMFFEKLEVIVLRKWGLIQ